uniref:Uncharacterized protein n=1 Tax=Rhizophora mucronata TaxID=61149 RepID=A0A2P2QX22_RHIMU
MFRGCYCSQHPCHYRSCYLLNAFPTRILSNA